MGDAQSATRGIPVRTGRPLRWLLRHGLVPLLHGLGLIALLRAMRRRVDRRSRLLILAYHRVHDTSAPTFRYVSETLAVSPDRFERQMAYLSRNYTVLPLDEAARRLAAGSLPRGDAIAITFDDGYRDNATLALPILERHGLTATVFLSTDFIGTGKLAWFDRLAVLMAGIDPERFRRRLGGPAPAEIDQLIEAYAKAPPRQRKLLINLLCEAFKRVPDGLKERILDALTPEGGVEASDQDRHVMLDWPATRLLAAAGIAIGSHSCSHPILSRLPPESVPRELIDSKRTIEAQLGRPCTMFAYPNGRPEDCPEGARELAMGAGYDTVCTGVSGVNGPGADRGALRRIAIGDYSLSLFATVLEYWLLRPAVFA